MSQLLIQKYLNNLMDLRKVSGTHRESVIREAFKDLLKNWGRSHDLIFVPEYEIETPAKERRYVDGALLHSLRVPFGYWEAKDEQDDLDKEIEFKFQRGYPKDNIVFEDSIKAVLIQNKKEVIRCSVEDVENLEKLLNLFFTYQRPEIANFRKAVKQFKVDLPAVLNSLRNMIETAEKNCTPFREAAQVFLHHAKKVINPALIETDVREMLIQHILTEEVFSAVFPSTPFHQDNNVAKELYNLEETFFTGNTKFQTLQALEPYYAAIRSAAAQISSHSEKQTFLKVIYENFYKVYNVKLADRLGVVYTPNEVVRFMIESADWFCEKHFEKNLIDKDVEILDPAVGTGTYICELLEHFRGQVEKLKYKYTNELHANEVAILPYYVANLNIEATYASAIGDYLEYPNLCFVDTLDNTFALAKHVGHMDDLFGALSEENSGRISRQNDRRISVIIGNPPYNANQLNENENNKNREYPEIDKRIKKTYVASSNAQKTKLYDMYARFFRWASDRLGENGILAFITNRGFIDKRTYDGFRKIVEEEFQEIHLVDLGGDVRDNPKLSGTKHNIFGIQTGVAISFLVRNSKLKGCKINYYRRPEFETAEEKLSFLGSTAIKTLSFEEIKPDKKHNWINLAKTSFEGLIPIGSKEAKVAKSKYQVQTIFKLYSLGISTNRDEWVIDFSKSSLEKKMDYFISRYAQLQKVNGEFENDIKWSRNLKRRFKKGRKEEFQKNLMVKYQYRPFVESWFYDSNLFVDERGSANTLFPRSATKSNKAIAFIGDATQKPFSVLASDKLSDLNFLSPAAAGTKILPLYCYANGVRVDNITDWALNQFENQYNSSKGKKSRSISKEAIFNYVYGILHDPIYRETYALNLKREFPHIPFYKDFWQWSGWGRSLVNLHLNYENTKPFKLKLINRKEKEAGKVKKKPKVLLKADKEKGLIILDSVTTLSGVPIEAWNYKLGNRSAIEWILDQFKEKRPRDPTIREKFNAYHFYDYKEQSINLLRKVTEISVETMSIIRKMRDAKR